MANIVFLFWFGLSNSMKRFGSCGSSSVCFLDVASAELMVFMAC